MRCKKRCGYGTAHAKVHTTEHKRAVTHSVRLICSSCQAVTRSISHNACESVDAANEGMTSSEAQGRTRTRRILLNLSPLEFVNVGFSAWTVFTNQAKR